MAYLGKYETRTADFKVYTSSTATATHTLSWTPTSKQSLRITINGVVQQDDAFSLTGNTVTLDAAILVTDVLEIVGVNELELVTADGGFDFSIDFNKQEQLSYRIIFCEIVCALATQKKGGNFVCKIFDMYTYFTVRLIFILKLYYNVVIITKPYTSRQANSEKYIISKDFKGISEKELNKFYEIVDIWDKIENSGKFICDISLNKVPIKIIEQIVLYNKNTALFKIPLYFLTIKHSFKIGNTTKF